MDILKLNPLYHIKLSPYFSAIVHCFCPYVLQFKDEQFKICTIYDIVQPSSMLLLEQAATLLTSSVSVYHCDSVPLKNSFSSLCA